jgi:hypothetical protein
MKTLAFLLLARISGPTAIAARRYDLVVVAAFTSLCAFFAAWPIWRAFFPMEIDLKEPWNAYHADAVVQNGILYPDLGSLVANNYPPFWYYLTGMLSWFGGDAIYIGRAVSFAALIGVAVAIALCIRRFNATWPAAMLGAAFFFGTMVRFADWYVAMNDPHVPALALMTIALLWFLRRDPKEGAELPLLLMVVAGFFKQALVAIPATALFLLACRNTRLALRGTLVAGGVAFALLALFAAIYGTPFIDQMFFYPREISLERAWNSVTRLGALVPAVVIWLIWVWHDRASEAARFTVTFMSFAFAAYVLQKAGAGVDVNAQFELNVAAAIAIGLAFDRIASVAVFWGMGIETRRLVVTGVLALGLIVAPGLEPFLLFANPDYRDEFVRDAEVMRSEVERIAAMPGAVRCSIDTVCRAAGKPFYYDVFFIGQKGATGHLMPGELHRRIVAKALHFEAIDPRASMLPLQRQLFYGRAH